MKKIAYATILAVTMGTAQAADVGVNVGYDNAARGTSTLGVTASQKLTDKVGVAVEADVGLRDRAENNRFTLVGSYDVATLLGASVAAKAGVAAIDPQSGRNGLALVAGVGAELPVPAVKNVAVTFDYRYQLGQDRVSRLDGSRWFAGVKYKF